MLRSSPKQKLLITLGIVVPVAIFFVAHSAASWRPQLVAQQSDVINSWNRGSHFLQLSPDEKWLIAEDDDQRTSTLWDLTGKSKNRTLQGTDATFSGDSQLVATYDAPSQELYLSDSAHQKWHRHITEVMELSQMSFAPDNLRLQYRTGNPNGVDTNLGDLLVVGDLLVTLDAQTGKELSRKALKANIWQSQSLDQGEKIDPNAGQKISRINSDATKLIFSLHTSNSFDRWEAAPDGRHVWLSLAKFYRFDIRDAKTGHKLWSYSSNDINGGEFACYPLWDKDGKRLSTIENNTLVVRDSHTGKVLLSRKNNLPAPLKSWAFTHDRKTVYLMVRDGRIFRQRLK
ncbi:hypothetical protein EON83_07275 [bacterium]|nr:MAG: hypothetical protein EON83_07275 [bacterium]